MIVRPVFLIVTASLAPVFWLGQVMLSYFVTAQGCYPGDAPGPVWPAPALQMALWAFDAVALLAALAGGAMSLIAWRQVNREDGQDGAVAVGRTRFLVLWGLYSSLWFFFAILFNAIGSFMVMPCAT